MPAQHWPVTPAEAGQKLLQFLQRRLQDDVPKSMIMRWIRTGQVRVDGGRAKPFQRLDKDQTVRVPPFAAGRDVAETTSPTTETASTKLDILDRDGDLLVLVKPAGLPMHPGSGHTDCLTARLHDTYPDAPFAPTPAHRLDKDTSGLVLVALSYRRLAALHGLLRDRTLTKRYLAWVDGEWPHEKDVLLEDTLAKTGIPGREAVARDRDGKPARAVVRPLAHRKGQSLLEVELITGRTHQIRSQLSLRSYPVVNDPKYGRRTAQGPMYLHAWRIALPGAVYASIPPWKDPFDAAPHLDVS